MCYADKSKCIISRAHAVAYRANVVHDVSQFVAMLLKMLRAGHTYVI